MSVTRRDYYEVLGVARDCDDQILKGAYRKLALQFHPDRNPGHHSAEERFKEAAEAYSVLSDPQKRAAYDRFGHQGVPAAAGGGGRFEATAIPELSARPPAAFWLTPRFAGSWPARRDPPARAR